jgi:hypothetical protein
MQIKTVTHRFLRIESASQVVLNRTHHLQHCVVEVVRQSGSAIHRLVAKREMQRAHHVMKLLQLHCEFPK